MRVGVNGAAGRMGRTVCAAVVADPDLELVAAADPGGAGETVEGIEVAGELPSFADAGCDVVVDFTVAAAARDTLPWLALHGMHAVVGTTGFNDDDFALFESSFGGDDGPNAVIAANFAISAVLMMRFAEMAAPHFDTAEIIELHHDRKIDAPSGTAVTTTERIAAAHRTLRRAREEPALPYVNDISATIGRLGTATAVTLLGSMMQGSDVTASNVPGPQFPLWSAGAKIGEFYAFGPLAGSAINITLFSYNGTISLAMHTDRAAVTDGDLLVDSLEAAADSMLAVG